MPPVIRVLNGRRGYTRDAHHGTRGDAHGRAPGIAVTRTVLHERSGNAQEAQRLRAGCPTGRTGYTRGPQQARALTGGVVHTCSGHVSETLLTYRLQRFVLW